MTYIDFYTVKWTGEPDFIKAAVLVGGDDEAEWFITNLERKYRNGPDEEDSDEVQVINGVSTLVLQYHNGQGDGGDQAIANVEWFAKAYPAAYAALSVTIAGGKGTAALVGNPAWVL